jgi:hypothetical protein
LTYVVVDPSIGARLAADRDEQPQRRTVCLVIGDGLIATRHLLVADLAFAGVVVHLLRLIPSVEVIAVGASLLMIRVH